ncbi:multidrug transporter [Yamadazyma tenuis]|nr:multidrug transporter [Yamadazyma tenuis]
MLIICMLIYIAATIALSQANAYWLLAVLRCIQAGGIGPVIAISSGVSGDICTVADRGGFVGLVSGLQLTGNAFGGLIGAGMIHSYGWRGIFVMSAIGAGITMMVVILVLPETIRSIVGNGTVKPKICVNIAPIYLLKRFRSRWLVNQTETLSPKTKLNLLAPFKILFHFKTLCVLFSPAIKFAVWTMTLTSLTLLEGDGYNYTVLKVGYMYLPQGVTCFAGSLVSGRLLNWSYKRSKKLYDDRYQDVPMAERPKFNVLRTRIYVSFVPTGLQFIGIMIYGWCLQYKMNIASIIIATCLVSYSSSSAIAIYSTVLVDMNPQNASLGVSLMNLTRCCTAALCVGILSRMTGAMGLGGTYTFWAGIGIVADTLLIYVAWYRNDTS